MPILESDRQKDTFSTALFTVHFIEENDVKWLENFKDCNLSEAESRALLFVRKIGFVDNSLYRALNQGVNVVEASSALRRLRDLELIESRSKGATTFYIPGARMIKAGGIASHISAANLPDNGLSGKLNLPDNEQTASVPIMPQYLTEAVETLGQRATFEQVKYVIWRLCGWRALQVTELAAILQRNRKYVHERFISPMIKSGELRYTHPDNPAHPHQAYKAVSGAKRNKK